MAQEQTAIRERQKTRFKEPGRYVVMMFNDDFTLEDIRQAEITLTISGRDGFALEERGAVGSISRDPTEIVGQMIGAHHQYPDGAVLYLGTPFSPSKDRAAAGMGFTPTPRPAGWRSGPWPPAAGRKTRALRHSPPRPG